LAGVPQQSDIYIEYFQEKKLPFGILPFLKDYRILNNDIYFLTSSFIYDRFDFNLAKLLLNYC